ncbi:MAG: hypothetical protein HF314_12170 [Ignavibacteria bacterium]|jgi:enoyl-[acyl-carrier-protein] reductase (NADH)|nr:hypothetical protein [Ignavibacteria bacterium]MCU7503827.1 hypothetical protein [Ignavibacteria bacterium]MCU7517159.1 hypothetical protein [Ignavibacteria bacterium]
MMFPFIIEEEEQLWITYLAAEGQSRRLNESLGRDQGHDVNRIILGNIRKLSFLQAEIIQHLINHAEDEKILKRSKEIGKKWDSHAQFMTEVADPDIEQFIEKKPIISISGASLNG